MRLGAGACVLLVLVLVRVLVLDTVVVGSDSMAPSFCAGDRLLLLRGGVDRAPQSGDVVTFEHDDGDGARSWLKRVVAVGGQTVTVDDGVVVVDGAPAVEPYLDEASVDGTFFRLVTVPDGSVFVLGDGREFSTDSRDFGPVPVADVTGRVVGRVWSSCDR